MKLTPREDAIFLRLRAGPADTDQLMDAVDHALPHRLKATSRASVIQCVKYMSAKVAEDGWCIRRTSPVGRGHIGEYEMKRIGS
jgi:hypothetical protein